MALQYGIARDGAQRRAMGERLAHLVRSGGYHISTGFVCTPIILDALTATGHLAAAERLLTQTECPSWLYPVTMGATTILERWDSMLDDGTINPGEMTSFNHYALRAVADWLHRVVAGLAPDGRGYREIQVAPRPLASLDHARASLTTPYGPAEAGWRRGADGAVTVDALVPANTTARVRLPGSAEVITVGSGRHSWTVAEEPESPPGRLSADSDLARIVDDREAYRAVISAVEALAPEHARDVRSKTRWLPTRTLADSLFPIPPAVSKEIAGVLDSLQKQRDAVR